MCCLFGLIDYKHTLSRRQKTRIVRTLAELSEERGTDAAGIAYNSGGTLRIDKHPGAAHTLNFKVPRDSSVVMGHTRMTTQGSALKLQNNHPFAGNAHGMPFALAHNGTLYNDRLLRKTLKLPDTNIETDSYVAVQLIEQAKALDFDSLRHMAEKVEGSFCFTVLDRKNDLYIVKGDNPFCLVHYPEKGIYLYASTERILANALLLLDLPGTPEPVELSCGDILCIDSHGRQKREFFSVEQFLFSWASYFQPKRLSRTYDEDEAYLDELRTTASWYGYDSKWIDDCLAEGFSLDEIEGFLYCGEL